MVTSYAYRADGMRTLKSSSLGSTLYRYDGQMGVQDVVLNANGTLNRTIDYALGGRGIEGISTTTGSTTVVTYPLYDTHGNMVSTLTKGSGGSYSYSALRSFDAWGKVRLGATTGDPTGRYCANLGHKQDDESDLIYMRARYYEPSSGRFLNQDPARNGANWFAYCENDSIKKADQSGNDSAWDLSSMKGKAGSFFYSLCIMLSTCAVANLAMGAGPAAIACLTAATASAAIALGASSYDVSDSGFWSGLVTFFCLDPVSKNLVAGLGTSMQPAAQSRFFSVVSVTAMTAYTTMLIAALGVINMEAAQW